MPHSHIKREIEDADNADNVNSFRRRCIEDQGDLDANGRVVACGQYLLRV